MRDIVDKLLCFVIVVTICGVVTIIGYTLIHLPLMLLTEGKKPVTRKLGFIGMVVVSIGLIYFIWIFYSKSK